MQGYYGSTEPVKVKSKKNLSQFIIREHELRMIEQIRNIIKHEMETLRKQIFEKLDKKEAKNLAESGYTKVKKFKKDKFEELDSSIDDDKKDDDA